MKVSTKKAIAREVLILVVLACTGLLIYLFLFLKNYALESLEADLSDENLQYRKEIRLNSITLPISQFFTKEAKPIMYRVYSIAEDTVYVTMRSVPFLEYNYRDTKRMSIPKDPYLKKEFKTITVTPKSGDTNTIYYTCEKELAIKLKYNYSFLLDVEETDKEIVEFVSSKYESVSTFRTILFAMEEDEFFHHLESKDYQDAFYAFINENIRIMDKADYEELIAQVSQRKQNIERVKELEAKHSQNIATISRREKYYLSKDRIWPVTLNILIVLGIAVYPLRFIVRAVRWSIHTLRTTG